MKHLAGFFRTAYCAAKYSAGLIIFSAIILPLALILLFFWDEDRNARTNAWMSFAALLIVAALYFALIFNI